MIQEYKEFLPWILTLLTGIFAVKKEWILSKFTKKEKEYEIAASRESVEASSLENVEKTMMIYRGVVNDLKGSIDDLKSEVLELKSEITDLKTFINEQKKFISKQKATLARYEEKFGKLEI